MSAVGWVSLALFVALVVAFVLHEALVVAPRQRGAGAQLDVERRARDERSARAQLRPSGGDVAAAPRRAPVAAENGATRS